MLSIWNSISILAWRRVGASFGLALLLSLIVNFLLLWFSAQPHTLAVINGRSEFASFSVFNPELTIIYGNGLRISSWPDSSRDGKCAKGAVLPGILSIVSYQRIEQNELQITINGPGELRLDDSRTEPFDGEVILYGDASCGQLVSKRFPIWGPGKVGSAFSMRSDGPGPILLSGTLEVYGRTIDVPLFGGGGAMYSASQPQAIPAGSFIESNSLDRENNKSVSSAQAAMFGFVEFSDEPGLAVNVSTESPTLHISTPGALTNSSRIDVGLFVQVLNDPGVLKIQLLFALPFLLWPIFIDLVNLALSRSEDDKKETDARTDPSPLPEVSLPLKDTVHG